MVHYSSHDLKMIWLLENVSGVSSNNARFPVIRCLVIECSLYPLLCILTSEGMLAYAFAWSKSIKNTWKWVDLFRHSYMSPNSPYENSSILSNHSKPIQISSVFKWIWSKWMSFCPDPSEHPITKMFTFKCW